MSKNNTPPVPFQGFASPNYTQTPNEAFDAMRHLTGAEFKCLMYIIRNTFGYKDRFKKLSLSQFTDGRRKSNGEVLDTGTGLLRETVVTAIRGLVEKGYIIEHVDDTDKGRILKAYELNVVGSLDFDDEETDYAQSENPTTPSRKIRPPTQKETVERNFEKQLPVATDVTTDSASDIYTQAAAQPTSIDDFTTRADDLTNAHTRQQPFEALKDSVTAVWGWDNQGVVTNVAKMLAGKRGKGEYEMYRFDAPMTADELEAWAAWYRRTYPKLSLAQKPETIAKSVSEYRAAKTNAPAHAAPVIPVPEPETPATPEQLAEQLASLRRMKAARNG